MNVFTAESQSLIVRSLSQHSPTQNGLSPCRALFR